MSATPMETARTGRSTGFVFVLSLTVCLRLLYSGVAALFVPYLKLDPALIRENTFTADLIQRSDTVRYVLLGVWERFDTLWYIHIACHGYDRPDSVVFYPLYPLLIRISSAVAGQPLVAALTVSTIASFFMLWGLYRLLSLDLQPAVVRRATVLCGLWPAGFIFFTGYAESLVLALVVWSIYFARTDRWWCSGILAFLGGLSKAVGALTAIPLAVLAWRKKSLKALPAALSLLGPVAFILYLRLSGRPLPSEVYAEFWRTEVAWPWATLVDSIRQTIDQQNLALALNLGLFAVTFALAFSKKLRVEYVLYVAAALCFLLLKKSISFQQQWARYALVVFPAYANFGKLLEDGPWFVACSLLAILVNAVLMYAFLEWSLVV